MVRSKEDMIESNDLCEHCHCTNYGEYDAEDVQRITVHSAGCEGSWCDEAYDKYLDNEKDKENEDEGNN